MFSSPGNKYAQKWTADSVRRALINIAEVAMNEDAISLGETLIRLRISPRAWSYWRYKFAHDDDILDDMALICLIFENRVLRAGCDKKIPAAMAMFILRHNHQWDQRPAMEKAPAQPQNPHLMTANLPGDRVLVLPRTDVSGLLPPGDAQ